MDLAPDRPRDRGISDTAANELGVEQAESPGSPQGRWLPPRELVWKEVRKDGGFLRRSLCTEFRTGRSGVEG